MFCYWIKFRPIPALHTLYQIQCCLVYCNNTPTFLDHLKCLDLLFYFFFIFRLKSKSKVAIVFGSWYVPYSIILGGVKLWFPPFKSVTWQLISVLLWNVPCRLIKQIMAVVCVYSTRATHQSIIPVDSATACTCISCL